MKTLTLVILVFLSFPQAQAAEAPEYNKPRLSLLSVITEIPSTSMSTLNYSFTRESVPAWATIVTSTAVLYHYDQDLYDGAKADGRRWGLGNEDKTKTMVKGFGFDLVRLPSDTGSALYFLGDGWTHSTIAASFFLNGLINDHNRSYNTGLQMVHGMIVSTIFSQALKHATGRQSPNKSTEPRGRWRPFPSIKGYNSHTPEYDAYPSGHVMTATLIFTIMHTNYPEYASYIIPVEVLWISALGFQMMNNGVHWASDYPLGIAIGYAVAKMSTKLGESKTMADGTPKKPSPWTYFASAGEDGPMLNAMYSF